MIKLEKIVVLQELKRKGLSISAIARRTGMDRKTVRKLLDRGLAAPSDASLPLIPEESAPALSVSRPARRSLALRPAWSLSRQMQPFCSKVLQPMSLPHDPLRLLPAGASVARRDSHPQGESAFPRRTGILL